MEDEAAVAVLDTIISQELDAEVCSPLFPPPPPTLMLAARVVMGPPCHPSSSPFSLVVRSFILMACCFVALCTQVNLLAQLSLLLLCRWHSLVCGV